MRVKITEIIIEKVAKGKGYEVANVTYQFKGETRSTKILSFANPATFAKLSDGSISSGDEVDVTVTKNDKGYNQWAAVEKATAPAKPASANSFTPSGSRDFETKAERQARQVYIVKQSSITNAIAMLSVGGKQPLSVEAVLNTAQQLVDYVFNVGSEEDLAAPYAGNENISEE